MPRAIRFQNDPYHHPPVHKHYICHCQKVGEEEIAHTIIDQGARTLPEVLDLTRAMQTCNCGSAERMKSACCYQEFREVCERYFAQVSKP